MIVRNVFDAVQQEIDRSPLAGKLQPLEEMEQVSDMFYVWFEREKGMEKDENWVDKVLDIEDRILERHGVRVTFVPSAAPADIHLIP